MRLLAQSHIANRYAQPTEIMAKVQVARAPGQTIVSETLSISPDTRVDAVELEDGRLLRGIFQGQVEVAYSAVIDLEPRIEIHAGALQHRWSDLPADILPYLMPSRFCPSDKFLRFAGREFGNVSGGAKMIAIVEWIRKHVDYLHGVSTAETGAESTFIDRAGVCRDFTHLGLTLARAGGIPARAVAAYALALDPPDFHAVFEVWLGNGWWLIDPTGLAPIEGLIRIAHGRDAADIAFLTTSGPVEQVAMTVSVAKI
ncbi:transglutaminase-like domain-containing protein [Glacieibacterium sp.]|uniref:transglutaminase-like domain-containing protein n=1 Tax=Glacieibacterium sp. TaxID=2860237 RepID=UPI003B001937